jgi:D-inositol-3-phosphate glycosyltransferase
VSFGLVAVESPACGTPVGAAAVDGRRTAVAPDASGLLVDGHDPADYAVAVRRLLSEPGLWDRMAAGAVTHARRFGWGVTAAEVLDVYVDAIDERRLVRPIAAAR